MAFDKDSNNLFNCYKLIVEQAGAGQSGQYWDPWQGQGASVAQLPDVSDLKTKYIGDKNQFEKLPAEEQNKRVEQFVDEIVARGASPQWGDSLKKRTLYTTQGNENGKFTAVPNVGTLLYNIDNYAQIQSQNNNPQLQAQIQKDPKLQSTYAQPEDMREIVKQMNDPNYQTNVGNLSRQEENEIRSKVDNAQDVTRNEQGQLVVKSTGKLLKDTPTKTTSRRYGSNDAAANASNANTPPPNSSSASPAPFSSAASSPAPVAAKPQTPSIVGASMSALGNSPAVKPFSSLNTPNIMGQAASNAAQAIYNSPQMTPVRSAANAVRDIYGAYANNSQRQIASQSGYDNQNPAFKEQQRQIALRNAQEAERQMRAQTSQSKPLVAVQPASPQNPQPPQLNVTGRTPQQIYGMPQNQQNARPFNPQGQRYSQPQQPVPPQPPTPTQTPWYKKPYNQQQFTATKSY